MRGLGGRSTVRLGVWVVGVVVGLGRVGVWGQEVSPEVQRLYGEAQAAQRAGRGEVAVRDYREILRQAPELGPAYNNLGRLLYNMGRFGEAVPVLEKGLAVQPGMAPAEVMLGASYLQLGQMEKAKAPLEAGVAAMPEDRFARVSLARVEMGLGESAAAEEQLQMLVKADAKDQEAWYLLGKVYQRRSEEALATMQSINPDSALALDMRGELMQSMGNTPGAVEAYKRAAKVAPEEIGPVEHLATVYYDTGDWAHGKEWLGAVLQREPGNCVARWKLGKVEDELAEPVEGPLREVNAALAACPGMAEARAERARLLLRAGKPAEAVPDLLEAEKAAPDETSVQQLLAQAYRALGEREKADAANRRFVALERAQREVQERKAAAVTEANR